MEEMEKMNSVENTEKKDGEAREEESVEEFSESLRCSVEEKDGELRFRNVLLKVSSWRDRPGLFTFFVVVIVASWRLGCNDSVTGVLLFIFVVSSVFWHYSRKDFSIPLMQIRRAVVLYGIYGKLGLVLEDRSGGRHIIRPGWPVDGDIIERTECILKNASIPVREELCLWWLPTLLM